MPQKKAKKKGDNGVSLQLQKVGGYAYTKKFIELQALVRSLQAQAEAAKQQVEYSQQREMVLLDLTVHQEQVLSLFHHQILRSARQQLQQQQQQQALLGTDATAAAAPAVAGGSSTAQQPVGPQQRLQQLHEPLMKRVARVQQQHGLQEGLQALQCNGAVVEGMDLEEDPQPYAHGEASTTSSCLQQQQQQQQQGADVACLPINLCPLAVPTAAEEQQLQQCHPASCSYVGGLLQAAATDEAAQQRVLSMTAADWSQFFTESFYKLLLLLEMADRDGEFLQAEQPHAGVAGNTLLAGTCPARHSSSAGHAGSMEQQQQQHGASLDAAAAAASSSGPLSHMQQLEQLVDEWVTLSALALILHPLPVYVASTMNHATQLPCAIPEGHHDRVVRRMQLTQQQVRHFAAVLEEISRLDDVVMAQGGQLARNAACPNTLVLAAEAERGAAAAAAAGGARAGAAKSDSSSSGDGGRGGWSRMGHHAECEDSGSESSGAAAAAARQGSAAAGPSAAAHVDAAAGSSGGGQSAAAAAAAAAALAEASNAVAAAPAEAAEHLAPPAAENLLQRNIGRLPLHNMLLLVFNCNTLTRLQLAKCIVASYPFIPLTGAIAASAAKLHHQQQRHRQLQRRQQQQDFDEEEQQPHEAAAAAADAEVCCYSSGTVQDVLHSRERHVLQQRRLMLDSQLQQWRDQLQALGLADS